MWFGTQDYAGWVQTPQSGADVSPSAWGSSGTLINGSGYAMNSYNSHKRYVFSWKSTSDRQEAQLMKSYFEGSFGRGKLYFHDPLTYTTNVLAARWADPSITCDFEGPSLIPGVNPRRVRTGGDPSLRLPLFSAQYSLPATGTLRKNHVFIPIPEGMTLAVGAFYEATDPTAGVYVAPVATGGQLASGNTRVAPNVSGSPVLFSQVFTRQPGTEGVALWLGKTNSSSAATLTVNAIHARLFRPEKPEIGESRWYGGQGNSGVRFEGPPTYINNTGANGGQVEFAASFIESVL